MLSLGTTGMNGKIGLITCMKIRRFDGNAWKLE
jgi:hypothetical protein